jgi:hypothetical protein
MSIQEWAAIAEIIGAIAVVASLVYLAVQIRQNTHELSLSLKSTELAAFERNVEAGNRTREMFILNPEVADLYVRGLAFHEDLNAAEKMRFDLILSNVFSALQGAYVRQLTYGNDPANFAGSEQTIDQLVSQPGIRDWLGRNQPDWRPEFATLVAQRVKRFDDTAAKS